MTEKDLQKYSLSARGARCHLSIAVVLITILPALAMAFFAVAGPDVASPWQRLVVGAIVIVGIALGYAIISHYPSNIVRLRKYLEDMVNGRLPEKVELIQGMDDIPAIEHSLQVLVEQLNQQVIRLQAQMEQIDGLMKREAAPSFWKRSELSTPAYEAAGPASGTSCRFILDSVGESMLRDLVSDLVVLLETSAVCFEENGDVSCRFVVSDWCRCLSDSGQESTDPCLEAVWRDGGRSCLQTGLPNDLDCPCGTRAFLAPVMARDKTVGVLGFTYGDPPTDPTKLRGVSGQFGIPVPTLLENAKRYEPRPPFIVSVAKNRLLTAAKLIGEVIDRRQVEQSLLRSQEELRKHRDNLEHLVEERTSALTQANDLLEKEIDERRKAERLKEDFVSTVSHELRTPLAITKEGISLLLDGIPGPLTGKQRRVLVTARSNIDRLARMINDLLDISKIEAGKMQITREPMDLAELVRQAVIILEPLAEQKGIRLEAGVPDEPQVVYADSDRIMQVLTNLVGNAVRFTKSGSVRVFTECRDLEIECSVQDTGVGMPPEDVPKLFQKFVQLHRVEGAGQRGTGLGLVISKNIVELHRGRIWVKSRIGEGTVFTFTLERYLPEILMRNAVEEAIADARTAHQEFLLMLLTFDAPDATPFADADFERNMLQQLQSSVVRSSDRVLRREDRQVLLMTVCGANECELVRTRWGERLETLLAEHHPTLPCTRGWAVYPADGFNAGELITRAEKRVAGSSGEA